MTEATKSKKKATPVDEVVETLVDEVVETPVTTEIVKSKPLSDTALEAVTTSDGDVMFDTINPDDYANLKKESIQAKTFKFDNPAYMNKPIICKFIKTHVVGQDTRVTPAKDIVMVQVQNSRGEYIDIPMYGFLKKAIAQVSSGEMIAITWTGVMNIKGNEKSKIFSVDRITAV